MYSKIAKLRRPKHRTRVIVKRQKRIRKAKIRYHERVITAHAAKVRLPAGHHVQLRGRRARRPALLVVEILEPAIEQLRSRPGGRAHRRLDHFFQALGHEADEVKFPRRHQTQLLDQSVDEVVDYCPLHEVAVVFCRHLEEEAAGEGDHGVEVVWHAD